jgi:nucleoside-diphosphate-sugar epimerase
LVEILIRVIADALMLNATLAVAYTGRYIVSINQVHIGSNYEVFLEYLFNFARSSPLVTAIGLLTFSFSGFYTRGRAYRSRFKVLVVAQAVSLTYLIFGFVALMSGGLIRVPRGVVFLGWMLTLVSLVSARLWSLLWSRVVRSESKRELPRDRKIETVLVIGGAGYIGSALLRRLLDRGYRVRLLDLFVYGQEPIKDLLEHPRLEICHADFRHIERVTEAMRDMDAVIHLGAIVGDPACALDEDLTIDVNLMATRMIAEIAKGYGVNRFIFASTCSVYGASDEFLDEHSALNPLSLYARSKIASEKVLAGMADDRFIPVILRFGTIYGLSGRTRFDLVVNLLTAKAIVDGEITVMGGDQWRPFVHVDDAALAVFKVLEAPLDSVDRQVFNVGSDEQNATLQQVGELIQGAVAGSRVVELGSNSDRRNYRVSFHKIRKQLGFEPQWTLERGILQVKEAFESGKILDYRLPIYNNVKFLSEEVNHPLVRREDAWVRELLETPFDRQEKHGAGERAEGVLTNGHGAKLVLSRR